jgi:modulator of FtsH protease
VGAAYSPAEWSSFFSAQTGASAALTGLIFVAVSINLAQIVAVPHLIVRSAKALFTMVGILLASTLCMVPAQPVRRLGVELIVLGAAVWAATTWAGWAASHGNPYVGRGTRIQQAVLTQLSGLPALVGGLSLVLVRGGGLEWLVAGAVFSYVAALLDAWVLLIEIHR